MKAIYARKSSNTGTLSPALGILGGTFDPIHFGHLRTALDIQTCIGLNEVRLLPCHIPGHRDNPSAGAHHRIEMIRLAIEDEAGLSLDTRECNTSDTSYTVNTLLSYREELGNQQPICLIMGMDSFCTLPQWYRWQEILNLAHIIVVHRPGSHLGTQVPLSHLLSRCRVKHPQDLLDQNNGGIWIQNATNLDISSSHIRQLIKKGQSPRYLLPNSVWQYIQENKLYGFNWRQA